MNPKKMHALLALCRSSDPHAATIFQHSPAYCVTPFFDVTPSTCTSTRRSVPTYQAFGLMEARRGNHDKARELFERGIQIDSQHAPIFHAWATMEEQLGDYNRARDLFNAGVEAAPSSVALLKAWSTMELRLGHIEKSIEWAVYPQMGLRKLGNVSSSSMFARKF